jgi:hypothetical protein
MMPGTSSRHFSLELRLMHPAQRRAILAIITMIEQAVSQLKAMFLVDDEPYPSGYASPTATKLAAQTAQPENPHAGSYTDENEDERWEKSLEDEAKRLAAEREGTLQVAYDELDEDY